MTSVPFDGWPGDIGSPTIEDLYAMCRADYKRLDNEWHDLAGQVLRGGGVDATAWRFRSDDPHVVDRQMAWLTYIIAAAAQKPGPAKTAELESAAAWVFAPVSGAVPHDVARCSH